MHVGWLVGWLAGGLDPVRGGNSCQVGFPTNGKRIYEIEGSLSLSLSLSPSSPSPPAIDHTTLHLVYSFPCSPVWKQGNQNNIISTQMRALGREEGMVGGRRNYVIGIGRLLWRVWVRCETKYTEGKQGLSGIWPE